MDRLQQFTNKDWFESHSEETKTLATHALEHGKVLFFPELSFPVYPEEMRYLSESFSDPKSKNISFDPKSGLIKGVNASEADRDKIKVMVARYSDHAIALVKELFPHYRSALEIGRTSFRPVEIFGRTTSFRKDDTRLHVDAFPSTPNQGRRILRVFANINPQPVARVWRVGEPFEVVAKRFMPKIKKPLPGSSFILKTLGITKTKRTSYDAMMLQMHDLMKADLNYQKNADQSEIRFPTQCSWMVFTDLVSHAAMSGQHALEQTFYLPVEAMHDIHCSPLKILERLVSPSCKLV